MLCCNCADASVICVVFCVLCVVLCCVALVVWPGWLAWQPRAEGIGLVLLGYGSRTVRNAALGLLRSVQRLQRVYLSITSNQDLTTTTTSTTTAPSSTSPTAAAKPAAATSAPAKPAAAAASSSTAAAAGASASTATPASASSLHCIADVLDAYGDSIMGVGWRHFVHSSFGAEGHFGHNSVFGAGGGGAGGAGGGAAGGGAGGASSGGANSPTSSGGPSAVISNAGAAPHSPHTSSATTTVALVSLAATDPASLKQWRAHLSWGSNAAAQAGGAWPGAAALMLSGGSNGSTMGGGALTLPSTAHSAASAESGASAFHKLLLRQQHHALPFCLGALGTHCVEHGRADSLGFARRWLIMLLKRLPPSAASIPITPADDAVCVCHSLCAFFRLQLL